MNRASRVAFVTGGLALTGAVVGAMLSPLLLLAMGLARGMPVLGVDMSFLAIPAIYGAAAGAILAPIASWSLMRHVPIGRAIVQTLLGTILGASVGMFLGPVQRLGFLWPIVFGITGFMIAAARLRWSAGTKPTTQLGSIGQRAVASAAAASEMVPRLPRP